MISEMDRRPEACGSQILKTISILDAIYWVNQTWNEVQPSTIQKCFNKVGFVGDATCTEEEEEDATCTEEEEEEHDDDDVPLAILKLSNDLFGCDFRELKRIDREVKTCDENVRDWTQECKFTFGRNSGQ